MFDENIFYYIEGEVYGNIEILSNSLSKLIFKDRKQNKIDQGRVEEYAFESDLDESIIKWFKDRNLLKSDKLPLVNFSEFIIDLFTEHTEYILRTIFRRNFYVNTRKSV